MLETEGVDSIDLLYQIDNGLPSEASTKSFLRMICNETSQFYLEQNQYRNWPLDVLHDVFVPYRTMKMFAHPWGGGCEPVWFKSSRFSSTRAPPPSKRWPGAPVSIPRGWPPRWSSTTQA